MDRKLRVALVGAGLGGLTAAVALNRHGFEVHIFEQAGKLRELGAGIGLSPNPLKVLRALGLEEEMKRYGTAIEAITMRNWSTGEELFRQPLKGVNEGRFGLTNMQAHRGDLLNILAAAVAASQIHLGSRCVDVASSDRVASLTLSDGTQEQFDLVVGCDGIGSRVRAALHGPESPRFTGNMCWRALVATQNLPPAHLPRDTTFWVGPGGHIATYYIRHGALVNVVAVRETAIWLEESWSVEGDVAELRAAFPDVHDTLRVLLGQAEQCFKWGLFDRDPLPTWTKQRVTLLGDAAHPMLPFLGQGVAMAIEDAYVLARELARSPHDVDSALRAYEAERVPRTAQVQLASRERGRILHKASHWDLSESAALNIDWLYHYDPTRERMG